MKLLLFCLSFCLQLFECHSQVCIPTWTPYPRLSSKGGFLESSVRLMQDCLARCERRNNCVAVDFNRTSYDCWLHYNLVDLANNSFYDDSQDSVTQYRINRTCTYYGEAPECPLQWFQNTSIGSYNGEQVNYWTEYDCFTYCRYLNSCIAVDYDNKTSPPCWMHKDLYPHQVYYSDRVVHYRLYKTLSCPSAASPSSLQIGRCAGQYFSNATWCPSGAKIHIEDAWFKINPLCCYRNAEDAYPPDASSLVSIKVSYLDPSFFNEINSSCEGQSVCKSSIKAKSNSAFDHSLNCLDGEIGTNYVSIAYQCIHDEKTTPGKMTRKTTAPAAATGITAGSTVQISKNPDVDKAAALDNTSTKENSDRLIIGLVVGLGLLLILVVIIVVVVILVKRRKRRAMNEPDKSQGVNSFYYTSETMPRGVVPENEQKEISMSIDSL